MGTEARWAAMEMEVRPCPAERETNNPCAGSCRCVSTICICILFALVICLMGFLFWISSVSEDPEYSVAITAVSGLDPAANAGGPAVLDLEFTLNLRIASRSPIRDEYFQPGTSLEVTYRDIPLARVTPPEICAAGLKGTAQATVVAWGAGARLPGFALDSLAADVRRSAEAFDVTVRIPSKSSRHDLGKLVSCRARRVGDADALRTPCDLTYN